MNKESLTQLKEQIKYNYFKLEQLDIQPALLLSALDFAIEATARLEALVISDVVTNAPYVHYSEAYLRSKEFVDEMRNKK